jgi:hypothetical protein
MKNWQESLVACLPVERGSPVAPPACPRARSCEGAAGMRIGSMDEGSPARGPGARIAFIPVEQDRRWPRPRARSWGERQGCNFGGDGGSRDVAWQRR